MKDLTVFAISFNNLINVRPIPRLDAVGGGPAGTP